MTLPPMNAVITARNQRDLFIDGTPRFSTAALKEKRGGRAILAAWFILYAERERQQVPV